ncbi:MAG TPA: sialidase family protein [Acidimicrobiia bacterium]
MSVRVGTADGLFVLDGAAERQVAGHSVSALSADWAIFDGETVVYRANGEWRQTLTVQSPERSLGIHGALLSRSDEAIVGWGPSLTRVFKQKRFEPIEGFESVPGREEWHAVGSRQPYVRSLTETPEGVLLASVHVGGIPRSTDGGATWLPTIDVDADVHQVRAHPDRPELVLAAAAVGLCRSDDAGATWTVHTDGLHASYCRAVATAGDVMFVTASTGPFTDHAAVYRRAIEGDGPFERCTDGLPDWQPHNIDTGCLDTAGARVAFGGADGVVYGSEDAGRSWRVLAENLPPISAVTIDRA